MRQIIPRIHLGGVAEDKDQQMIWGDPSSWMIFCCENYFPSFMDALLSPAIIIRHLAHGLREETQIS